MASIADRHWTRAHGTLLLAVALEPKEIGKRIASARRRKGWTQLVFALEADVSPSTVQRWEAGLLPPVRELMRIADLLGVEPEELVELEPTTELQIERITKELRDHLDDQHDEIRRQFEALQELLRKLAVKVDA